MRYKNPPFKKTIRDDLKTPQPPSEETQIKVPAKSDVKRLWWSKYNPELKNPKVKK